MNRANCAWCGYRIQIRFSFDYWTHVDGPHPQGPYCMPESPDALPSWLLHSAMAEPEYPQARLI